MFKDWPSALKTTSSYLRYLRKQFHEDRILVYAGYLAYVTLLSLVPLITVLFSAFSLVPVFQVGAHPADQGAGGLSAFDQRAGADTAVADVPVVGLEVSFGPDHPGAFDARFCIDAGDAVDQQERRSGEADLAVEGVLTDESRAEEV